MFTPKVSVTIPIYNSAKYLNKCLDSLMAQTIEEAEFILIDDGSTDGSGLICEKYALKDKRFRVIHQKNCGSAAARQTGLNAAKGDYVIVCDSDDWVEPNIYERLYKEALLTDAEIIVCGYFAEYPDGRSIPKQVWFKEKNGYVDNNDFLRRGAGSSWIKLIKRSLFDKAKAAYEPGINLGEDAFIILKLMKSNPKVAQCSGYLYHYRRLYGQETYTNKITEELLQQLYYKYNWIKNNYCSNEYNDIKNIYASSIVVSSLRSTGINILQYKRFISQELTWKIIFSGKFSGKGILIILAKMFPYKWVKFLFKSIYPYIYQ